MWFLNAQLVKQMLLNPVPSKQAKLLVPLEIYFTKNLCRSLFMQKKNNVTSHGFEQNKANIY